MIQEAIRSLIEIKLNDNTENKTFVVGSYAYLSDENAEFVYSVKNGYTLIDTNYISAMIVFTADYDAIPTQVNGNASISITFLLSAETQAELQTDLETLDEFVSKIIGNSEEIVDGSKTYQSVWNMSALIPAGLTDPINGTRYVQVQTTVYVGFSDTNYFGNAYQYTLNENRIYPYDVTISRGNEENNPHLLGDAEAKGGNSTSTWTETLIIYVNEFISTIVDSFSRGDYDMECVYELKEVTPTRPVALELAVKLQSAVYTPNLGEKVFATLVFYKSDDAYVETTYTITYTLNGGTNNVLNPATFVESELPVDLLDATKTNYAFNGWFDNVGLTGTAITQITTSGNKAYYAKFTFSPYNEWVSSDLTEYNQADFEGMAVDVFNFSDPEVTPGVDANLYEVGTVARVSDGAAPYYYYKVSYVATP